MSDEWGPWIDHGCQNFRPVPAGTWVMVDHANEGIIEGRVTNPSNWQSVIRYRIRKPRGMTILQEIVANPEREAAHDILKAELGRA